MKFLVFSSMNNFLLINLTLLNFVVSCNCSTPFLWNTELHLLPDGPMRFILKISILKLCSSNIFLVSLTLLVSAIKFLLNSSLHVIILLLTFLESIYISSFVNILLFIISHSNSIYLIIMKVHF